MSLVGYQSDKPSVESQPSCSDMNQDRNMVNTVTKTDPISIPNLIDGINESSQLQSTVEMSKKVVNVKMTGEKSLDTLEKSSERALCKLSVDEIVSENHKNQNQLDIIIRRCRNCNAANIVENISDVFHCYKCMRKVTLEVHFKHTERVKCTICGFELFWRLLGAHMLDAHYVKKKRKTVNSIKMYEFISMKLYKCGICKAIRITDTNLKKHHQINHADIPYNLSNFQLIALENSTEFVKCCQCKKNMKEKQFIQHMKHRCGMKEESDTIKELSKINQNYIKVRKQYRCKLCKQSVNGKDLETHHSENHYDFRYDPNWFTLLAQDVIEECPICGRYANLDQFEKHMKRHHENALFKNNSLSKKSLQPKDLNGNNISKLTKQQKVHFENYFGFFFH